MFLSVAALGQRGEQYLRDYLAQTMETVKARTVVPVHWDDFTKPVDEPLIAVPNRITDVEQALAHSLAACLHQMAGTSRTTSLGSGPWQRAGAATVSRITGAP